MVDQIMLYLANTGEVVDYYGFKADSSFNLETYCSLRQYSNCSGSIKRSSLLAFCHAP